MSWNDPTSPCIAILFMRSFLFIIRCLDFYSSLLTLGIANFQFFNFSILNLTKTPLSLVCEAEPY